MNFNYFHFWKRLCAFLSFIKLETSNQLIEKQGFMIPIKICGITLQDQADQIADMGVHALGFILYNKSKRYISPEKIHSITKNTPPFIKKVGVVVNENLESIRSLVEKSGIDLVQLHGDETPELCELLSKNHIRWIKAIRVTPHFNFSILKNYPSNCFLFDVYSKHNYGGTGKTLNWEQLKEIKEDFQMILSGGLNPTNVVDAVKLTKPIAIDVSSGVEISPGVKNLKLVQSLIDQNV